MKSIKKTKFTIIFCLLVFLYPSLSQNLSHIELGNKRGYILAHTSVIKSMVRDHFNTLDLNLNFQFDSTSVVYNNFNNPSWGINYMYSNWAAKDLFGSVHGISSFINFPLIAKPRFKFIYKMGAGLAYITNPFETDENFHNLAIGSPINAYINFDFLAHNKLHDRFSLSYGLSFYHTSNAAFTMPNLGINVLSWKVALNYHINNDYWKNDGDKSKFSPDYKWELRTGINLGVNENYPVLGKKFVPIHIDNNVARRISRKSSLTIGLDYFFDPALIPYFESKYQRTLPKRLDISQLGLNVGYQLHVGNIVPFIQMGHYLHSKYKESGDLYHLVGIAYYINPKIRLNLTLKSHWAQANHAQLGINYCFKK